MASPHTSYHPPVANLLRLSVWVLMAVAGLSLTHAAPSGVTPAWRIAHGASTDGSALFLPTVLHDGDPQPGVAGQVTLVAADAVWHYLDDGTVPDPSWRELDGVDDGAWPSGPAQLGYGDGDEATVIAFGPDPAAKPITAYFRHVFTVTAPTQYKAIDLRLLRDDGAVVYLNGHAALRGNLPPGPLDHDTRALTAVAGDQETTVYHYTLDPALLRDGPNVLAVEVHQANPTSSDLSFTLALTASPHATVRFAVIGDYGDDGPPEADVAARVKSWRPDFVITLGDNNYDTGAAATMADNVLKHYGDYITGDFATTRFFPSLGNHDWYTAGIQPYLDTFALPGNERYYDFVRGDVHFFVVDSDSHEPDGVTPDSVQGQWLAQAMRASTARQRIVYFHHAPYSSGSHGLSAWMQWPFAAWGADAVLAGHDHNYERLTVGGVPYFVNGLGGKSKRACPLPIPPDLADKSRICFDADFGAMLVETSGDVLVYTFITRTDAVIDTCTQPGTCGE